MISIQHRCAEMEALDEDRGLHVKLERDGMELDSPTHDIIPEAEDGGPFEGLQVCGDDETDDIVELNDSCSTLTATEQPDLEGSLAEGTLLSAIDLGEEQGEEDPWTIEFNDRALEIIEASRHSMPTVRRSPSLRQLDSSLHDLAVDQGPLTPEPSQSLTSASSKEGPASKTCKSTDPQAPPRSPFSSPPKISTSKPPKLQQLIKVFNTTSASTTPPGLEYTSSDDLSVSSFFSHSARSPSPNLSSDSFKECDAPSPKYSDRSPRDTREWGSPVISSPRRLITRSPRESKWKLSSAPLEKPFPERPAKLSRPRELEFPDAPFVREDTGVKTVTTKEDGMRRTWHSNCGGSDRYLSLRGGLSQRQLVSNNESSATIDSDKKRNKKRIAVRIRPSARTWQNSLGQSDRFLGATSSTTRKKSLLRAGMDGDSKALPGISEHTCGQNLSASLHREMGGAPEVSTSRMRVGLSTSMHCDIGGAPEITTPRQNKKVIAVSSRQMNWQQALGHSDRFLGLSSSASRKAALLASPDALTARKRLAGNLSRRKLVPADEHSVGSETSRKSGKSRQDRRSILKSQKKSSDRYLGLAFPERRRSETPDDDRSTRSGGASRCSGRSKSTGRAERYLGLSFVSRASDDRSAGGERRRSRSRSSSRGRDRLIGTPVVFDLRAEPKERLTARRDPRMFNASRRERTVGNPDFIGHDTPSAKWENSSTPQRRNGLARSLSSGSIEGNPGRTQSPANAPPESRGVRRRASDDSIPQMPRRSGNVDRIPNIPRRIISPVCSRGKAS